jgi:hypothetical protein
MNRNLLLAAICSVSLATFHSACAEPNPAKALAKYARQWDWKQSQDAFLKANKDAAGNELPGSDKTLGYLLYPADKNASADHDGEAHGFLDGDKVLMPMRTTT